MKKYIVLLLNAFIFIATALCVVSFFTSGGVGNMAVFGTKCFRFFTVDSNILCAVSSILYIVALFTPFKKFHHVSVILRFVGTTSVMLTFLTVMFFLGPLMGYGEMLDGVNLYMHLLTPVISAISLLFFEETLPKKYWLLGVVPMVLYGAVYLVEVLITKGWTDFYHFNDNGLWYVSLIIMLLGTTLVAFLLDFGQRKLLKK